MKYEGKAVDLRRESDGEPGMARVRSRLRDELDLAILTLFGGISAIAIAGFAIYRFLTGSLIGGILDVGISGGLAAIVVYAWRSIDVARAGGMFVVFAASACFASSLVFGRTATYWAFLVLSTAFVVTGPRTALVGSLALVAGIVGQGALFASLPERAIFLVTTLLVTVYGWIFSTRYRTQRRELERLALCDPLTQTGNRRAMRRDLVAAVSHQRKTEEPALLAVLDLDHFKSVNDSCGHEEGDRVLFEFAEIVRGRLRRDDGFYRLGGEEFVVLLRGTTLDQGRPVVRDLHRLVGEGMAALSVPVTVSIGVTELRSDDDWSTWLRRGDAAMYRAKDTGRNRVVIDGAPDDVDVSRDRRRDD